MKFHRLIIGFCIFLISQNHAQVSDFSDVDFSKADLIAKQNKDASLDNLPLLANNLTLGLDTDVEKFRSIYTWVCYNISNDYNLYTKNKRKRKRYEDDSLKLEKWNERFKKKVFSTLLNRKRTICTGYAYIVKTLCDLADIDCKMVDGFGKTSSTTLSELTTPNHTWNAVKLNDKWYLCDPTWASGTQNPKNQRFEFNYNDGLFLVSPKLFALSHYPIDAKWLLIDENIPSIQSFFDAPIIYGETYNYLSSHSLPQKLYNEVSKNHNLKITAVLLPNIESKNIVLLLDNGTNLTTVTPKIDVTDNEIKLNYKLDKYGYYDVHLMIDNQYIATYVYYVKRNLDQQ